MDSVDADDSRVVPECVEEYDPVTGEVVVIVHENTGGNATGGYVCAGDLLVGDVCIGPNGERLTVISTIREEFPNGIDVYNFEVAGTSCYYVIANGEAFYDGATPVLVHNGSCDAWGKGKYDSPVTNASEHFKKHGNRVGAKSLTEYTKLAEEMRTKVMNNIRWSDGKIVRGFTSEVRRFIWGGRYIDLEKSPNLDIIDVTTLHKIISFGLR